MNIVGVLGGVCERCKQQVADCHFVGLVDGREQSRIVCGACYQELVILELIHAKTHCRYCGQRPAVVINDLEEYTHDEPRIFLCHPCATEYRRVFSEEAGGLLDEWPMCSITQVLDARGKVDTQMRAWAAGAALQTA